jgi:hypothetical protein
MRTGVIFALLVALCILLGPVGSIAPLAAAPSQVSSSESGGSGTIIEIQIQQNGDARVSIVTTVPVRGENGTTAYEEAARQFNITSIEIEELNESFHRIVQRTSNATNRSMSIEKIDRSTNLSDGVARFTFSFTWKNFAVVSEDTSLITINDSFNTPSGTWLPSLPRNQTLIIRPPPGYRIKASPSYQGGVLKRTGPHSFEQGFPNPNITYVRFGSRDQITESPTATATPGPGQSGPGTSVSPTVLAVGTAVLIVIGSIGIFAFSRRERVLTNVTTDGGIGADGGEKTGISVSGSTSDPKTNPQPAIDPETDPDPDTDTETLDNGIDIGLLSDEERVERLLRENNGRMKQASIVVETDWSDAKVSQLLSAMDEAGRIEKLRIGRENLITLSDYDPNSDSDSDSD